MQVHYAESDETTQRFILLAYRAPFGTTFDGIQLRAFEKLGMCCVTQERQGH